jgi:hypothetical protein
MARRPASKAKHPKKQEEFFLKKDSPFMSYLRDYAASLDMPLMSHEEIRTLLDEDLGDRSLSDEVRRMRQE